MNVAPIWLQIQDGIPHDLPGSVIGDVAAAARLVDFDAPGSQRFGRDENMRSAAVAADTERQDGWVLDEQQRVSLARSLVNEPSALFIEDLDALFADDTSQQFSGLLRRICTRFSTTIIATAAAGFPVERDDRRIDLLMGTIARDSRQAEKSEA